MHKTPNKIKIPPGYIVWDRKWNDTPTARELRSKFNGAVAQDVSPHDFYIAEDQPVKYIPESQLITNVNTEKLKSCSQRTIYIADRNTVTIEAYSKLQDHLALDLGHTLLPIGNVSELPQLLHQLSIVESGRTPNNQFKRKSCKASSDCQLDALLAIPGLGKLKAQKLLDCFGNVFSIAFSSRDQLSDVVGCIAAAQVHQFFKKSQI